jgi:YggT family protein
VGPLSCSVALVVSKILYVYWFAMIAYAVVSWVPNLRGRWSDYLAMVVEPVLLPLRRIIPPIGGLDMAFLVVILLVGYVSRALPAMVCSPY